MSTLRKMIREEFAAALREKYGIPKEGPRQINEFANDDLKFVTDKVDLEYFDLQKPGFNSARGQGKVYWHADIELKSYGIKGIYFTVDKIEGVRSLEPDTDGGEEVDEDVSYSAPEWNFEIEHGGEEINYNSDVFPTEAQINEKDKTIIVLI